jgi:hypothetical protein
MSAGHLVTVIRVTRYGYHKEKMMEGIPQDQAVKISLPILQVLQVKDQGLVKHLVQILLLPLGQAEDKQVLGVAKLAAVAREVVMHLPVELELKEMQEVLAQELQTPKKEVKTVEVAVDNNNAQCRNLK